MSEQILTAPAPANNATPPTGTPPPAAAPAGDWRSSLPEDIRGEASLKDIKDVAGLAKGYVHSQRMLGSHIAMPKDDAKPEEWDAFYGKLGRPSKVEEYKFTEIQLPEGHEVDKEFHGKFAQVFHKLGLSNKQADQLRSEYIKEQLSQVTARETARTAAIEAGTTKLKETWGDKFDANVTIAKEALAKFSTPELIQALDESGAGSDPRVVEAFYNIGLKMQEDPSRATGGVGSGAGGFGAGTPQAAQQEIETLKKDTEFQKALHDRWHKDHKAVSEKWHNLHMTAYK